MTFLERGVETVTDYHLQCRPFFYRVFLITHRISLYF